MVLTTEWAQVEVIDLINDGSGLAFGIIGGRSTGVVVKTILPGGVADRDGRLQSGDHILQIGEVNLRGLGSEQVASVLRQCGVHVRMVVARPVESATTDYQTLGSQAPIVPTKILGDPVELDRHLLENGYAEAFASHPPATYTPFIFTGQQTDIQLHPISGMVDVVKDPLPIGAVPVPLPILQSTLPKMLPLDMALHQPNLPETEIYTVELKKDDLGLGITVAGYVCEKEEISGIFVKSISKGSAADLTNNIKMNDRIIEVDGISVIGFTNHQAVELLRNSGPMVKIKVERYLRGPKYEKLQQAIRANELRPPSPPSPTVSSLPKVPLSLVHMSHLGIEPEGDSRTSFDFDSAVILDATTPANGEEEKEIVIGGTRSLQFSISSQELIYDKWREKLDKDVEVVIAQMHKEENYGLGISLEGTVDVEDGKEVRPHHYIRNILPDGPVGRNGVLQSGDELLEVNGIQLLGLNHIEVVSILKQLPNYVSLVCARYPVPIRVIDTSQHLEAFQARKILAGSLQTLIASGGTCCVSDQLQQQSGRLVKAKSETSIASSMGSDACTLSRSRSLELIEGLPMWSEEHTVVELNKGDHGLGFSILDYQDPLNPQETVIVIRSLVPGGVAQYDGRLIPGDRLMAVNDVNVEHATLDAAVQVLKGAPKGVVKIAVAKPLNCQGDAVSQASQCVRKILQEWSEELGYLFLDTEDDHTCLEDFQECIEDFQECLDSVHICIDEDNSFNHSSCNSQVEDFGQKPPTHQAQKNRNLVLNSSDHFLLFESPITTNCLNLKVNRDSLGDSDADISFKSTNDSSLDNKNNSVVREINSNDINNCNVSDKPSSLSEKDGYETCLEETSLSEERTVRMNQKNLIFIETESSKLDDNTIKKKVQITNAESSSDVTPTNTFRDQFFIDLPPFIPSQNQNPKQTCTATSEPCLNREAQFQNTHHLCLDTKIEDGLKSYDQNAEDNCGDEFFLVQYPPDSSKEVSKSVSEPNVLETYGIPVISNRLTYRRCLREYYNDYQDCLEAYRLSCIGTTDTKECKVRNEMSDEDIFRQIFLPFKSKSAPNGMDSSFVTLTYDPGPDMGRRKSAFVPGYDFKESEMTVVRHIDPEYGTMKEYKVDDMLPKHWGSTQTVKVFREPNKSLGISIVGGKVDILPTEKSPNALLGIFVKNVVPNSPAGKTNKFKTGDRILEVSGIDLRQASHDKAVQAIRNASNPVTFVIQSLIPWANSENGSNKIYNGKNYESPTYLSPIKKPKTISPSNQQQTINNQNEANRSNTDSSQQYNNSNDVKSQNDTSATNQNYLSTSAANEENEFKVEANESSTVANAATSNKDGAADSDSDDDEDEEDVRELEGRTVSAKGHQIDRASAANVKRSKDEIAADAEPEDDFGYTMRYYDHEENKTIMNPWKVAKIFIISGTFIFDMLSLLPWLIHYGLYFFFRVDLPVLAYLFVLKVCRYPYWLKQMREIQLYYRMPSYLYKALRILISYFIVWIWSTAIIIFVNNRNDTHERSAEELLLLSLRSTQLLLNIGYGLKAKKTLLEIWLTILFTCFGFVLQLFLFINVLQFWQKYYSVANQQNAMNREVQEYLRYKGLPPLLRRKIFFYFDFKFRKRFYKEKTVFNIFSHRLKQEISITIARPYLIQVTRFFHLPKDFDAKIVNILSKEVYLPDDVIIRAGTEGDRLYMILYGTVAVYKPSGLEICHLQDGSYFGEVAVVLNVKRAADVIAVTACELYIIKKDSFREILRPFPSLLKTALDIAREKYIETTTRNSVNYELIADSDS